MLIEFRGHPEKYYGMLKGIDEAEFEYLNRLLDTSIDKPSFLDGKICIVSYPGFEIPPKALQGEKLTYCYEGRAYDISIAAVSYEGYHGGTANIGPNLIVSQKFLETLTDESNIWNINIKYDKMYDESTERAIQKLLGDSPYCRDVRETDKKAFGSRGTAVCILLIAITLTAGTGITYRCFQLMNYMDAAFPIPVLPVVCACMAVVIICMTVPLISYQKLLAGRSIVERLRDYE